MENYSENIGKKVVKKSGRPFKSTFQINTIKGVVINEQDPLKREAYTFNEDNSVVDCFLCKII